MAAARCVAGFSSAGGEDILMAELSPRELRTTEISG